mmetsp:Transcript_45088/g.101341  ORF Transcript_45088/g.101341 Transcript_45088/m.101341 type:complete len:114 (+) Transcript_45088:102-443(+)
MERMTRTAMAPITIMTRDCVISANIFDAAPWPNSPSKRLGSTTTDPSTGEAAAGHNQSEGKANTSEASSIRRRRARMSVAERDGRPIIAATFDDKASKIRWAGFWSERLLQKC